MNNQDDMLDRLETLRANLTKMEEKKIRLQGRLDVKMDSLKNLKLSSVKEAKKKIKLLYAKKGILENDLESLLEDFEEKYPSLIGEE